MGSFGTGALVPPGKEWRLGKNHASIKFVSEAEVKLREMEEGAIAQNLRAMIARIKYGGSNLYTFVSVDAYLENPRIIHTS